MRSLGFVFVFVTALICSLAAQQPDSCAGSGARPSPDVAYDPTHDVFLSAWSEDDVLLGCWAATRAVLHDSAGTPLLQRTVEIIQGGGTNWVSQWSPRVANVQSRGKFVVVWGADDFWNNWLGIRVIDAATGALGAKQNVASGSTLLASNAGFHDIGGDRSANGDTALVVYGTRTDLHAQRATVTASGGIQLGGLITLRNSQGTLGRRTIASHAGESGRHLIVFAETLPNGDTDVRGIIVDRNNQIVDEGPIAASSNNEDQPHVDGDGDDWLVAYRNRDDERIECVRVTWNSQLGTSWAAAPRVIANTTKAALPVVAALGDSYAISYTLPGGNGGIASVDATACTPCETPVSLSGVTPNEPLAMGVAPTSPNETLAVVGSSTPLAVGTVIDGFTTDLGGGCAAGGRARAHCAIPGNQSFELGLTDGPAETLAFVALSGASSSVPCAGGCTLIPDLANALVLAVGSTDQVGNAGLSAPLPNVPSLVGGALYEQWLLFTGTGCFGSFALSNAIRVELQ